MTLDLGAGRLLPTLEDLDPAGQTVLVRVDYNVPLDDGRVADDTRIRASLPTLQELLRRGASLVLMSHLGRPKGPEDELRLAPVGRVLDALLDGDVATVSQVTGPAVEAAASALQPGDVLLLENLRFDPGEKANDPTFAQALAALADVYVDDAFGTAHRAAASTVGVTSFLPSYAGRLMERELDTLGRALDQPDRPFVAMFGGAKISDKLGVLRNVLPRADAVLVGGGMANTFLAARGVAMGDSLVEVDRLADARDIAADAGDKLLVPADLVIADAFSAAARRRVVDAEDGVPPGWRALDVGPRTVALFQERLHDARTVVWNGPMGVFEMRPFAAATFALADVVAGLSGATTIVGGGDSAAAIEASGDADGVDWISTGGGAMLTFLAGEPLPAVEALLRHA